MSFPGDDDYGARSWSPTYAQYYAPRWGAFVKATSTAVAKREPFNQTAFVTEWHTLGEAWATGHAPAPTEPVGDIAALAAAWLDGLAAPLAQQFERVNDVDVRGGVLAGVMTTDVRAMAALCAKWPRCHGFTSDGQLRSNVGHGSRVPAGGGGCGRNSTYHLVAGFDLCTADTCNDFAPGTYCLLVYYLLTYGTYLLTTKLSTYLLTYLLTYLRYLLTSLLTYLLTYLLTVLTLLTLLTLALA